MVLKAPAQVILCVAQQLEERYNALILVPVPVKPMIYSEGLGGKHLSNRGAEKP